MDALPCPENKNQKLLPSNVNNLATTKIIFQKNYEAMEEINDVRQKPNILPKR